MDDHTLPVCFCGFGWSDCAAVTAPIMPVQIIDCGNVDRARNRETFHRMGLLTGVGENDSLADVGCLASVGRDPACCNLVLRQKVVL